jgi:parallel beta-helix repeat protein
MKTSLTIALALGIPGALLLIHPSSPLFAQGALTPPGAPAPTMKTLDQIEPRTPISALPLTISAPGSYYLTRNLTATADGTAITVSADNVTIDLNGFTLAGGGTGIRAGIQAPVAQKGLCVRNGTLTGWTNSAIAATLVSGGVFENLRFTGNSGIAALRSGNNATVRACVATGHANSNAVIGTLALGSNSTISDCTVSANSNTGITIDNNGTIVNCTASGNGFDGIEAQANCSVLNCTASTNTGSGIVTQNNCTVTTCTASANTGFAGIAAANQSAVTHCTTSANSSGVGISVFDESTVADCTATANSAGMQAGNGCTISRCAFTKSTGGGLIVGVRCHVTGCTFESNNAANTAEKPGLEIRGGGNRIDNNHFANNGYAGLKAYAAGNLIIRNTFSGAQYIVAPYNNTVGPTVDLSAAGGTISSASGTPGTNPWANIMF